MTLSTATQALLDTAVASHQTALDDGVAEQGTASAALLAQQTDILAKATALASAQQANTDLMAAIVAIQAELATPIPQ